MSTDFKEKRINYLNNWPNVEPFDIEKKYYSLVEKVKKENKTIFFPFQLEKNNDTTYNKTISFMIEAVEQLEKYPNFSYEFIFKAYDCFIDHYYPSTNLTDKNKKLCENEWKTILNTHSALSVAFEKLISTIPVIACQYLYIRLSDNTSENKAYQRVTTDVSGGSSISSQKRKNFVDDIYKKYGVDYTSYDDTIRNASLLYRYILKNKLFSIDEKHYNISIDDKLHILVSGFLYTLRNDIMHGSSISITKSSKTSIRTFAMDYFSYLLLYYLLIMLIIHKYSSDYLADVYERLATNIEINIDLFKQLFGRSIES